MLVVILLHIKIYTRKYSILTTLFTFKFSSWEKIIMLLFRSNHVLALFDHSNIWCFFSCFVFFSLFHTLCSILCFSFFLYIFFLSFPIFLCIFLPFFSFSCLFVFCLSLPFSFYLSFFLCFPFCFFLLFIYVSFHLFVGFEVHFVVLCCILFSWCFYLFLLFSSSLVASNWFWQTF